MARFAALPNRSCGDMRNILLDRVFEFVQIHGVGTWGVLGQEEESKKKLQLTSTCRETNRCPHPRTFRTLIP